MVRNNERRDKSHLHHHLSSKQNFSLERKEGGNQQRDKSHLHHHHLKLSHTIHWKEREKEKEKEADFRGK